MISCGIVAPNGYAKFISASDRGMNDTSGKEQLF